MSTYIIRWESWALTKEADEKFRKIVVAMAIPFFIFALVTLFLHLQPPAKLDIAPKMEEQRYVKLLPPPPPPPKPKEKPPEKVKPVEKPKIEPPKVIEKPKIEPPKPPEPTKEQIRKEDVKAAQNAGLLKMASQLSALRDTQVTEATPTIASTNAITSKGGLTTTPINLGAASTSGGVRTGGSVSGSSTATGLGTHQSGTVASTIKGGGSGDHAGNGGKGGRGDSEIEEVMERNRGSFNVIYSRAARNDPSITAGKVVVRMTIAPDGSVTDCVLVSSTFNNSDMEEKIVARVKLLNFGPAGGPPITKLFPFSFVPT
jgi:outer membrane biosynthesis protein TonB